MVCLLQISNIVWFSDMLSYEFSCQFFVCSSVLLYYNNPRTSLSKCEQCVISNLSWVNLLKSCGVSYYLLEQNRQMLCDGINWSIIFLFSLFQIHVPAILVTMATAVVMAMAISVSVMKATKVRTVNTHFTALHSLNGRSQRHWTKTGWCQPPWNPTLYCHEPKQPWHCLPGSQRTVRKLWIWNGMK